MFRLFSRRLVMARGGTALVTTPVEIFSPADGGCTAFKVHCITGSATYVEVQVERMHTKGGADAWVPVRQGYEDVFRMNHADSGGITRVTVRGFGEGETEIDYGVVADTDRNDER
jgi:hypothetical protein